ncbi:MAG: dienelactone hydrolase family protein [Mailhella sp.]|nr:dienelactone hydrolase family protein [Mailhella sp.]
MSFGSAMLFPKKASLERIASALRLMRSVSLFVLMLALPLFGHAFAKDGKPVIHAGYRTLSSSLPSERLMLHMGAWYPTLRRPGLVKAGGVSFRAARNAPVFAGPWPVIVLSHDVTGNAWAHRDIAASLAGRGFIVVAPTHDHDNGEDMRMLFSDRELPLRAIQLRAALDAVLEHKLLGPHADASRVGYLGFGMPAPAGLLLAGGTLAPDGWKTFVEERKEKGSPWLLPYAAERMDALVDAMRHRTEEREEKTAMLKKASESRSKQFQRLEDSVVRAHQRQLRLARTDAIPQPPVALPLLPPLSHDRALADSRFRALALVSPGYSMLFSRESLSGVREPIFLAGAGQDACSLPCEQAERLRDMLPQRPSYILLPHADMPSFHSAGPESDPAHSLGGVYAGRDDRISVLALLDALQDFFTQAFAR